jgi:hypothetical protein
VKTQKNKKEKGKKRKRKKKKEKSDRLLCIGLTKLPCKRIAAQKQFDRPGADTIRIACHSLRMQKKD